MSIEVMKRIKSLLQDTKMIDSHTISAVVAECDTVILAKQPATTEPVKAAPYNPTEEMRWAMKRIDPALSSEQCRALWSAAWSASPSTHPAPSIPMTERELELIDGMVALQLGHAQRCDAISNRDMAEKQKGWDMERVELLRRIRSLGITAHAQKGTNGEIN